MGALKFSGITKSFGTVHALEPLDLEVADGEFLTLLGPSGSGKTTLLNICAGYLPPSAGRLLVNDVDVTELPPRSRNMGMVFQNYALFPHMTVGENVAYGLQAKRRPADEIKRRVDAALAKVQLSGYTARPVGNLSGGQQQRVALARAMVIEPAILLMDEPLGALDRQLRKDVQLEIRRMHVANPRTTIYVTHDQEEALVMSDRIAVMRGGRIVQIGNGRDLYERPVDSFVARFLGESNLLSGRVLSSEGGRATIAIDGIQNPVTGRAGAGIAVGWAASMLIRPENVRRQDGGIASRVVEVVYLGELTAVRLAIAGSMSQPKSVGAGPGFGANTGIQLWSRQNNWKASVGDVVEIGWETESVSILSDVTL